MTNEVQEFIADSTGERLDKLVLKHVAGLSRTQVQALIKAGDILVDGEQVKAGFKIKGGERVAITLPEAETPTLKPEAIPLNVLYEDEAIAVIEKEAGMVVYPGMGNETGTLVHALLGRWSSIAEMAGDEATEERMGIVHRLDKGTSGVMVVALNKKALTHLMAQFHDRTVEKTYLAWLERTPKSNTGRIEASIARDPRQRKRMAVRREGKSAITEFTVIDNAFRDDRVLVKLNLLTGRTHQIRVHMAFIGCPVVGDTVYGFRKQRIKIKRPFLHAAELSFDHPITGERLHFESPVPAELQHIMSKFRT